MSSSILSLLSQYSSSSSTSSSTSSSSSTSQLEQLVTAYKAQEQSRLDTITSKISALQTKQTFFNNLNSKISNLLSNIDKFGNTVDVGSTYTFEPKSDIVDDFVSKSTSSSNKSIVTAESESDAIVGSNYMRVNRIATNDILVTKQLNLSDTYSLTGEQSFELNGNTINVDFGSTSLTNQQAMIKIVQAINQANEDDDIGISASLVKDTSTTGRITLTTENTGATKTVNGSEVNNDIRFTSGSSVFDTLGLDASLNNGTTSRRVFDQENPNQSYYRASNYNNLNSEIIINGVTVTRSSNEVEDALQGVTFNLLAAQDSDDADVILKTDIDTTSINDLVKPLLDSYNSLLTFLGDSKSILRDETSSTNLRQKLRRISSEEITFSDGSKNYLTDMGITISSNGTLSISDFDKLEEYLEQDNGAQKVAELFTSSNGFIQKITDAIGSFTDSDGIINSRKISISKQIQSYNTRYSDMESRIDREAETLRNEYESTLELYYQAQNQYSLLSAYST